MERRIPRALSFLLTTVFDSVKNPLALSFVLPRVVAQTLGREHRLCRSVNGFVKLPNRPNLQFSGILLGTLFATVWFLAVIRFGMTTGMSMWFADRVFRVENHALTGGLVGRAASPPAGGSGDDGDRFFPHVAGEPVDPSCPCA